MLTVEIRNMPKDPDKYVVARAIDGELWYWGSWLEKARATDAAREMDGIVAEVTNES